MKPARRTLLFIASSALLTCGCSSLHPPPAEDKEAWLGEQQETKAPAQQNDAMSLLYYTALGLGYGLAH
jgi:hypothetical protein